MEIRTFPDPEEMSREAASFFRELSDKSIRSRGKFAVALSGGRTPRGLYTLLGSLPYRSRIDWEHVHLFWADERCVGPEDAESNYRAVADTFLTEVCLPKKNIHRIRGEMDPEEGSRDYELQLKHFFGASDLPAFDLVVLGLGEDGHTASLFPGSKVLQEKKRLAVPVYMEKPGYNRITLTLPVLNNATQVLFLAAGAEKADIVKAIRDAGQAGRYPAGMVEPVCGEMRMFLDAEAAG